MEEKNLIGGKDDNLSTIFSNKRSPKVSIRVSGTFVKCEKPSSINVKTQ